MKQNIAVFFGGKSCEHDISIISAIQAINSINPLKYNVVPIYVDSCGAFHYNKKIRDIKTVKEYKQKKKNGNIVLIQGKNQLYIKWGSFLLKFKKISCAICVMHGVNGEDGLIHGILKASNIPCSGVDLLGGSIGLDKVIQKQIATFKGVSTLKFKEIYKQDFCKDKNLIKSLELAYPIIVKPANLGSSIGITVAYEEETLLSSIKTGFFFDNKLILEEKLEDFYEVNISAMRYNGEVLLSVCEKPKQISEILTFSDKYLKNAKTKGMKSLSRELPAVLSGEVYSLVTKYALELYSALEQKGVVRFDFLVKDDVVYFNEVNSIPGSLSYYLWQEKGVSFTKLIDMLIEEAIKDYFDEENLKHLFASSVL